MRLAQSQSARLVALILLAALNGTFAHAASGIEKDPGGLLSNDPSREANLLTGARREGEVVLYTGLIVNQALRPMIAAFEAKYPFLKVRYWRGGTEEIVDKIGAEMRANHMVGDVLEGTGAGEAATSAGIAQPYDSPSLANYPASYLDPKRLWAPTRLSYYSIAFNTKLVASSEAPRSYEDLLDPKWKGKLAWRVETESGAPLFITNLRTAWGEQRARTYLRKLASQKLINFAAGSARTLVDRVVAGEYPIALNVFAHHPLISERKGASVTARLLDPTPSTAATISIVKGAPHPNAALLFVDFILSKEGQTVFAKEEFFPANPAVPPVPALASVVPKIAGVPENFIGPAELNAYAASSEKIYQEMFR